MKQAKIKINQLKNPNKLKVNRIYLVKVFFALITFFCYQKELNIVALSTQKWERIGGKDYNYGNSWTN